MRLIDPELLAPYIKLLKEFSNNIIFTIIVLRESNKSYFKVLKAELQNQCNLGNNQYNLGNN